VELYIDHANKILVFARAFRAPFFAYVSLKEQLKKLDEQIISLEKKARTEEESRGLIVLQEARQQALTNYNAKKDEVNSLRLQFKNLFSDHISKFNAILRDCTINPIALFRLIGDEVFDRGANDLFIFLILKKLKTSNVPYEILISNHGVCLVEALELNRAWKKLEGRYASFRSLIGGADVSFEALQMMIDLEVVTRKEVDELVYEVYLPHLTALSYNLTTDTDGIDKIIIFSHAPVDIELIASLAKKCNVPFKDDTAKDLADTIDGINKEFKKAIQEGRFHGTNLTEQEYLAYLKHKTDPESYQPGLYDVRVLDNYGRAKETVQYRKEDSFEFLMWNRHYHTLKRKAKHKGYHVHFAYGHDSGGKLEPHVSCLDSIYGKGLRPNLMVGLNPIFYTERQSPQLVHQASASVAESKDGSASSSPPKPKGQIDPIKSEVYLDLLVKISDAIARLLEKANGNKDSFEFFKAREIQKSLDRAQNYFGLEQNFNVFTKKVFLNYKFDEESDLSIKEALDLRAPGLRNFFSRVRPTASKSIVAASKKDPPKKGWK
jgi:hypothetical protein